MNLTASEGLWAAIVTSVLIPAGVGIVRAANWYGNKVIIPESEARQKATAAMPTLIEKVGVAVDGLIVAVRELGQVVHDTSAGVDTVNAKQDLLAAGQRQLVLSNRNQHETLKVIAEELDSAAARELVAEGRGLQHAQNDDSAEQPALTPEVEQAARAAGPPSKRLPKPPRPA